MIAFFPQRYPDELIYSQIARYHQRSGNARFVFTAEDVYKNGKLTHPSVEFVNGYTDDAFVWLTKEKIWEEVAECHTMYPAYVRFLPLERRKKAVDGVINCNGNWKNVMCLPVMNEKRYLRYCPVCVKEDREAFGETYWHREHQLPRVRICTNHTCFLLKSDVPIFSKSTPGLFNAESKVHEYEHTDSPQCGNEKEIEFTRYLTEIFRKPINLENDYSVGRFLHEKLQGKYKNKSGILRNVTRLYEDYVSFYEGMPIMMPSYMQKIFNGRMFDAYYILQLAFFEGISVYDITHIPVAYFEKEREALFNRLATEYNMDCSIVAKIADEILEHFEVKTIRKSGPRKRDYEKLDKELLPKVKKLVNEMASKKGSPEKISVTKVQRMMELPQKCFNKLPRCKVYIEKHMETQEEYRLRKIQWAISEIEKTGCPVTMSKIMKKTNMRKREVESVWVDKKML